MRDSFLCLVFFADSKLIFLSILILMHGMAFVTACGFFENDALAFHPITIVVRSKLPFSIAGWARGNE